MPGERQAEYKPLSFSTTLRNPARIAGFLKCILPFEGQILTNEIIHEVAVKLISEKLYYTEKYEMKVPLYRQIYKSNERHFTRAQAEDIIRNSPQNHKERGFDKGWPSRFDTWYKLPMEFGFLYHEMNQPIVISTTGHMLIDAYNEEPCNDEKIKNVFLNALTKYQTNNPFRKNANDNSPLILLLQVIKLLKDDPEENDAGIFRKELSLVICWPDRDAVSLYNKIKELRQTYGYSYTEEIIYEVCLDLLGASDSQRNRFKIDQITGEAVDEFIRKMRITGIVSLRGNGRFLDFNSFESDKIEYILDTYADYSSFDDKRAYFNYMGDIDPHIVSITQEVNTAIIDDARTRTLERWATEYSSEQIIEELNIVCGRGESRNEVLRLIDKPTRLEFLTSIALKQNFRDLIVKPNYSVDDEGLPTFTAAGGRADIECFDTDCKPLVEVTLMSARNQATNEMPAITRHLQEAVESNPDTTIFSVLVAPAIHTDTIYMAGYSKHRYGVDIYPFTVSQFLDKIRDLNRIIEIKEGV